MFSSFGKNALFYAVGTVGLRTASFVLIPIYTYSLTVGDYGQLAVLLQTAQILMMVMTLGSRTALVRFAKEYRDRNEIGILLGTSIFINVTTAVVITIITTLLSPLFGGVLHTDRAATYLFLTCAAAAFNCLSLHLVTYYRAGQEGLKVTLANLLGAVALILLTIIFLRGLNLGIHGALLAQAIIYGLLTAFLFVTLSSRITMGFSLSLGRELVRFGLPLVLVSAGGLITQACGLYFLSYLRGLEEVSVYSLGVKMAQIGEMILILPFTMAYEPFVYSHIVDSRLWTAISRLFTYLMVAFAFVACGIVFIARDLLPVIAPPAYAPAYLVVFLVLPAVAFRGAYYIGESLLFLKKKTNLVASVVTTVTLISLALNYALIWLWGMYGAVAAFALTTLGTGATVLKLGLGISLVRIDKQRLCVAAALLIGFLATVYVLHDASNYVYYSAVPASVFLGTLLLYTSSFVKEDERRAIQAFIGRARTPRSVLDI